MAFSKQEHWGGLPFLLQGNLLHPGIKLKSPVFPALQAYSLLLESSGKTA